MTAREPRRLSSAVVREGILEIGQALRRAVKALGEEPVLTISSTGVLTAALLVLGTLVVVALQTSRLAAALAPSDQANVYLATPLLGAARAALLTRIEGISGVRSARYLGPEQALEELASDLPAWREWVASLGENPLPATVVVELSEPVSGARDRDPPALESLRHLDGVAEVEAPGSFAGAALAFLRGLNRGALGLAVALLGALLFIVVATLRLALHQRLAEIEIVRYAGATERWIRMPLWIEGALVGTVAGGVACAVAVLAAHQLGALEVPPLVMGNSNALEFPLIPRLASGAMLGVGPVLGALGAALAARWGLGRG